MDEATGAWLAETLGRPPGNEALFERALTHSSQGEENYERLEFLGDRVLGLVVATWLYEVFPDEPEGKLSRRFNALVARETCAEVARELGVGARLRLGKQARDDGASDSDNVIGDVVEALIGALYRDAGLGAADAFIRRAWADRVSSRDRAPKHPKSALQEWAAANDRKPPEYRLTGRTGPHHAPRFVVEVAIRGVGQASAEGASKQEAETAAAAKLLEQLD
ncbi:MAG: ribonuclease [Sphingomonadales bacterium]|jgi:ribonuclease-3|nr:ribonuclease [Sphingomonadales bacterium]MEA3036899.1 ribonuclease [Sphingomonadales bacterium]